MGVLNQFHHQIKGSPDHPKLVFLHGVMGYFANWRRITPSFESAFQILIYDQRGHGRSHKPAQGYRPEDYADDLKAILDELQWPKIHLVGHSMGGRNALNFAARFPERVEKLVIEDIGPDADREAAQKIISLVSKVPVPFREKLKAKEYFLNEFGNSVIGSYLYSNLDEKEGAWDWRFSKAAIIESMAEGRSKDRWDEWKGLKMPTLVIRGEKSEDFKKETYVQMLETNPSAAGVEIEGSGHWVHSEKPEEFISALKSFF